MSFRQSLLKPLILAGEARKPDRWRRNVAGFAMPFVWVLCASVGAHLRGEGENASPNALAWVKVKAVVVGLLVAASLLQRTMKQSSRLGGVEVRANDVLRHRAVHAEQKGRS